MNIADPLDVAMRSAAIAQLELVAAGRPLTSEDLAAGFKFRGERIPLVNPQRGIFKPRAMRFLLSIRTVFPRSGARIWYDDQRRVHEQIHRGEELIDYAFMGTDPNAADNRWLREAMEAQVPIIYFLGIAPGRYTAIYPTFVTDWSAADLAAKLGFGMPLAASSAGTRLPSEPERRYALRLVSQRLHQATFREAVLTAYEGRCAISRLPEPRLLDAAHIMSDGDETLGQPIVSNGLPLSKVHHAAFDAHLIGVDADYRVHVSEQLLAMNDGPMLEQGIKAMRGKTILMPDRVVDWPDRARLAARFELFSRLTRAVDASGWFDRSKGNRGYCDQRGTTLYSNYENCGDPRCRARSCPRTRGDGLWSCNSHRWRQSRDSRKPYSPLRHRRSGSQPNLRPERPKLGVWPSVCRSAEGPDR